MGLLQAWKWFKTSVIGLRHAQHNHDLTPEQKELGLIKQELKRARKEFMNKEIQAMINLANGKTKTTPEDMLMTMIMGGVAKQKQAPSNAGWTNTGESAQATVPNSEVVLKDEQIRQLIQTNPTIIKQAPKVSDNILFMKFKEFMPNLADTSIKRAITIIREESQK